MKLFNVEEIGKNIADARKKKNISQYELADLISSRRSTVSKWERGVNCPSVEMLCYIAEALDVSTDELLGFSNIEIYDETAKYYNKSKKYKYISLILLIIILIISVLFDLYYFLSNYKSVEVYKISSIDIDMPIGQFVKTRDKFFLTLYIQEDIEKLEVYYIFEDEEVNITSVDSNVLNIMEDKGYNEYFDYDNIDYILNNLYVRITLDNEEVIDSKLNFTLYYKNDSFFSHSSTQIGEQDMTLTLPVVDEELDSIIKDIFTESGDGYVYTKKIDNYTHEVIYVPLAYSIVYDIYDENYELQESWTYYLPDFSFIYNNYAYDYSFSYSDACDCLSGECGSCTQKINEFYNNFYGILGMEPK